MQPLVGADRPGDQHGDRRAERHDGQPAARRRDRAVRWLGDQAWGLLSTAPVLVAAGWLLVALPLLLLGALRPLPSVLLGLPAAAALTFVALRRLPPRPSPVWPVALTVALAAGFGVLTALTHSEHVVVRRDAGAYAQITYWLARHGALPIPAHLDAFGGPDPALVTGSPAFYADGGAVVPQFMSGLPLTLVPGQWVGGWTGVLVLPAVLSALALLAAGGLVARLVGPRWAPLGAGALALAQPVLHVAGGTYSEPLAQLFFLGGLCLLADALPEGSAAGTGDRVLAAVAGLALGLSLLVRIDAGRELALLVPVAGWLYVRRRPEATPLVAGLLAGAGYGLVDGAVLTRPYLRDIKDSLVPMAALVIGAVVVTAVAVPLLRPRAAALTQGRWWRPVPAVAAGLVVLAGALFAVRPHLQTVRGNPSPEASAYVASMQRAAGLPEDGARLYSEDSLHWLAWYVGWPLLVLALAGAAVLVWRVLRGSRAERAWVPALLVVLGSTALTLWRPGITPDHPWADRRFVPVTLPGAVLLAVFALAAAVRWARHRGRTAWWGWVLVPAGVLALTVPAAVASAPLLPSRTEVGEVAAVGTACDAFRAGDVVLFVDSRGHNEWPQVLRGVCGVPVASVQDPDRDTVARLAARAEAAGSRPLVATGGAADPLIELGARPERVVKLVTRQDQQLLTERPSRTEKIVISLWIAPATEVG